MDIPLPVQLKQENKEKPKSEQSRENEEQESKQSSKKRFATHEFSRSFPFLGWEGGLRLGEENAIKHQLAYFFALFDSSYPKKKFLNMINFYFNLLKDREIIYIP